MFGNPRGGEYRENTTAISVWRIGARALIFAAMLVAPRMCDASNRIDAVRAFIADPATVECLGFRWYIHGDDNGNATVKVSFRKVGADSWKPALPMLRVNREVANWDFEPYAADNMFAGSIFPLEPDTRYEVRFVMTDPEGGGADTTVVAETRPEPAVPPPVRTLHIWPGSVPAGREGVARFTDTEKLLAPGDLVLVHGGTHKLGPGGVKIARGGGDARPVVFRGAGDGEAILDGGGSPTIFDIRDTDNLFFERLTVRNGGYAFRADGARRLVIRRCTIDDVVMGIHSSSEFSHGWYIADNVITGRNPAWYPRQEKNPSHTGVIVYGRGHVIARNRISRFWDCIAIASYGKPHRDLALKCTAIDICDNDLSEAVDDGIESDYGCHNIRIFRNRIMNVHTGLSAQPIYGGPVYFIRNEVYNATAMPLKLHNWCAGLEIYHNTFVSSRQAFDSYARWQNGILRNNLFLGAIGYAMETGSPHPRTTLDYNGWRRADPVRFIKWYDGASEQRYPTLAAFAETTGHERHGVLVDYDIFIRASAPKEGTTIRPEDVDLSLKPGAAAVDAGALLPTVNDGFTGSSPDLGARESGTSASRFGPRGD